MILSIHRYSFIKKRILKTKSIYLFFNCLFFNMFSHLCCIASSWTMSRKHWPIHCIPNKKDIWYKSHLRQAKSAYEKSCISLCNFLPIPGAFKFQVTSHKLFRSISLAVYKNRHIIVAYTLQIVIRFNVYEPLVS